MMTGATTWLAERNRRLAREARESEQLAEAFETFTMRRLSGEIVPIFVSHGVGLVDRSAERAERHRVNLIIRRDIADRAADRQRRNAEIEVADGVYINLDATVLPPTDEWLGKHTWVPFTPRQPDTTVRVIRTVRALRAPIVDRLHARGKITDMQRAACEWYRDQFEAARLDGKFKTSHISLTGNVGGSGPSRTPVNSERELDARRHIREARRAMWSQYLRLFDAVVIDNIPISRAWAFAKCPKHKAEVRFRETAQMLLEYCDEMGIEFSKSTIDSQGD